MNICTIVGTRRPDNYTSRAMALVIDELGRQDDVEVENLRADALRLSWPGERGDYPDKAYLGISVNNSDGVVIAVPEYHGTFPAAMKLILENLGFPSSLKLKPVVLLGVAQGKLGAVKSLEHLRSVCSHIGALVLPGAVSVAGIKDVFEADGTCTDAAIEAQIRGVATQLVEFVRRHNCPKENQELQARGSMLAY